MQNDIPIGQLLSVNSTEYWRRIKERDKEMKGDHPLSQLMRINPEESKHPVEESAREYARINRVWKETVARFSRFSGVRIANQRASVYCKLLERARRIP